MTTKKLQNSPTVTRIAILGCGDIGTRLAKLLANDNTNVVGVRRSRMADTPSLRYIQADISDADALKKVLSTGFDIIIMTFTPSRYDDEGYRLGYVQPLQNLLQGLTGIPSPQLLLFVSSTGVYGQNDGSWVNENSATEPTNFSGKRLLEAEQLLRASPFQTVSVRFSGIYGPGRNRLINTAREKKWAETDQAQWTNRIHVDDCAGVLCHLIERLKSEDTLDTIYCASDSEPCSSWQVKQWLAFELGATDSVLPAVYEGPMHNKRCSNQRLLDSGYSLLYPSYQLGYRQVLANA